jgi:trimethylamine--corrinoid protein Co-methyltransferase
MRLEVLSNAQIEQLHTATIWLLENVGVAVEHDGVCSKMVEAGCNLSGNRLKIPERLVEATLAQVPGPFMLYGTRGNFQVEIGWNSLSAMTLGGAPKIFDPIQGKYRSSTSNDLARAAMVADWTKHISIFAALFGQEDVPGPLTEIMEYYLTLQNYTRVFNASIYTPAGVHYITEMAATLMGGLEKLRQRPSVIYSICPISPLRYSHDLTEALVAVASYGLPLSIVPLPILGISSPVTLAGALAQQNAEVLAGITIAYQYHPGMQVLYNGLISSADMRVGSSIWGPPEVGLMGACTTQLARHYNIPCKVYGFGSSSMILDVQNGIERGQNALMAALAEPSLIGGAGSMANLTGACLEQLIIDDEILDRIDFYKKGVNLSEQTLALGEIDQVVHRNSFLESVHTARNIRSGVLWRSKIDQQILFGKHDSRDTNMVRNAGVIVDEILGHHKIEPLPADVNAEIKRIIRKAESELLGIEKKLPIENDDR